MNVTNIIVLNDNADVFGAYATPLHRVGNWSVLRTDIEPALVAASNGRVTDTAFDGRRGAARLRMRRDGTALIKMHDYPNWRVTLNGQPARKVNPPGDFLEIAVPAGEHDLRWEFRRTWCEWLGYTVWLPALILCGVLPFVRSDRSKTGRNGAMGTRRRKLAGKS